MRSQEVEELSIIDARRYVKQELKKYIKQKEVAESSINYVPTPSLELVKTKGDGRYLESAICKKIDAERYCEFIEKALDKLEKKEKEILTNYYIFGVEDKRISIRLDLPYPTTYYRQKNRAVMKFYKYLLLKYINKKNW